MQQTLFGVNFRIRCIVYTHIYIFSTTSDTYFPFNLIDIFDHWQMQRLLIIDFNASIPKLKSYDIEYTKHF